MPIFILTVNGIAIIISVYALVKSRRARKFIQTTLEEQTELENLWYNKGWNDAVYEVHYHGEKKEVSDDLD